MKITGEFSADSHSSRSTEFSAVLQSHVDFATRRLGHDCQHTVWSQGDDRRNHVVDHNGAHCGIAGIEPFAVDHDLAAGDAVRWVYPYNFSCTSHKNRSSYAANVYSTRSGQAHKSPTVKSDSYTPTSALLISSGTYLGHGGP